MPQPFLGNKFLKLSEVTSFYLLEVWYIIDFLTFYSQYVRSDEHHKVNFHGT